MAGLGRIYRAVASIEPLADDGETLQSVDVMGPTDYALDYVARETSVPPLKPGDPVAIPNVGAYGLTASLVAFAGLQPPAEVCCRGTSVIPCTVCGSDTSEYPPDRSSGSKTQ